MSNTEIHELFAELSDFYGEKHQSLLCIEEMSELTKELVKFERGHENYKQIAEEVADVLITVDQVIQIYGIQNEVEEIAQEKLQRTKERLREDRIKAYSDVKRNGL